jgi:hypothetical protein
MQLYHRTTPDLRVHFRTICTFPELSDIGEVMQTIEEVMLFGFGRVEEDTSDIGLLSVCLRSTSQR